MKSARLIFTDLDGSLLDHGDYGFEPAEDLLRHLAGRDIPVIAVTSKTRAEVEIVRIKLQNRHPFIVENGAAVYIPEGYFQQQPKYSTVDGGYWVLKMSAPRERWLSLLGELKTEFHGEFEHFHEVGAEHIRSMTGLPHREAVAANQRHFSEPVKWLGADTRREEFIHRLKAEGASVLQGGRFLTVAGNCDKGQALVQLRDIYRRSQPDVLWRTMAIGDSANDCAMLELADFALLIRSPVHPFPELGRTEGVIRSLSCGPAGWVEGVTQWLQE